MYEFINYCFNVYAYLIISGFKNMFMDIFKYVISICLLMGVLVCMDTL